MKLTRGYRHEMAFLHGALLEDICYFFNNNFTSYQSFIFFTDVKVISRYRNTTSKRPTCVNNAQQKDDVQVDESRHEVPLCVGLHLILIVFLYS